MVHTGNSAVVTPGMWSQQHRHCRMPTPPTKDEMLPCRSSTAFEMNQKQSKVKSYFSSIHMIRDFKQCIAYVIPNKSVNIYSTFSIDWIFCDPVVQLILLGCHTRVTGSAPAPSSLGAPSVLTLRLWVKVLAGNENTSPCILIGRPTLIWPLIGYRGLTAVQKDPLSPSSAKQPRRPSKDVLSHPSLCNQLRN